MLKAVGYRLIIKPNYTKKNKGGLIVVENDRVGIAGVTTGVIVDIGPDAWADVGKGGPWAAVGDTVVYAKYGGKIVEDPDIADEDERKFVVINDQDIICKINGETPDHDY